MDVSPITNGAPTPPARCRPPVEESWLYRPEEGWTYAHHPSLAHVDGRFHAIWSNGRRHEDDVGQRVLLASSEDFRTWSPPRPLLDTRRGRHHELTLTAGGLHQHAGTLVAYVGRFEYHPEALGPDGSRTREDKRHLETGLWALTSPDGETWSAPLDLDLPLVPNHGPEPTASGRLILSSGFCHPWTDDPRGLAGWTPATIYPAAAVAGLADDSEGIHIAAARAESPSFLCEGSWYQTDDGVLHMLLRSNTDRLWVCESADDGETWSPARPTGFSDDHAKFHCGRLPDGRFYHVGNPDPGGGRLPLVLSLSADGVVFDRQFILGETPYARRRDGLHKGGQYGYPHSLVHDEHLYVICSRCKEAVQVLRVALADLV
jgi:hypothetical protein